MAINFKNFVNSQNKKSKMSDFQDLDISMEFLFQQLVLTFTAILEMIW